MKAFWKTWSGKLDELSLRERGLVFVVAAVLVVMLVHALALQPLLRQQRAYLESIRLNDSQLQSVNDALLKKALASKDDPVVQKRERARQLEQQLAEAQKRLAERRSTEISPEQLTALLREVLGGSPAVRLASVRVIAAAPMTPTASKPRAVPSGQAAEPVVQFYRHGVEIEMSGPYLELLKYLEKIETLPWKLTWSGVELRTVAYPQVALKVTLFAVSSSPTLIRF